MIETVGESMVVAGVMSGTSADGVEVAACRIGPGAEGLPVVEVLGHRSFPYPSAVREAVLSAMAAEAISVAELSRLNWRLGALYADAVAETMAGLGLTAELVGCHGQTIYHQAAAESYLGAPVRATWQTGEAAIVAERLRCPVVSDFRPADLAAGGQGAPLVPMLDWVMFRSATVSRVLANLGGIGNVTAMPAGCTVEDLLAFDTGPANMVIDECMRRLYGREFDEGGAVARSGTSVAGGGDAGDGAAVLCADATEELRTGGVWGRVCRSADSRLSRGWGDGRGCGGDGDMAITVRSMTDAYERFVAKRLRWSPAIELVVAGGGAKNTFLMESLTAEFAQRGVVVRPMEALGVAAEAKEAVAFALLAFSDVLGADGERAGRNRRGEAGGAGQGEFWMRDRTGDRGRRPDRSTQCRRDGCCLCDCVER